MYNKYMKLNRNIPLFYAMQTFSGLLFTFPIWVFFQHRLLSYGQMAWVQSFALIVAIILQLPTGAFADVFGRKKAMMLGWLVAGIANMYIGITTDSFGMIVGLLFVAIGTTFVSGADTALLFDTLKQLHRTDEFSKINTRGILMYRLSMIFAIFLGGYLYQLNIGLPVILKGIAQLITIYVVWNMREPSIDSEKFTIKKYFHRLSIGVTNIVRTPHIRILSLYYIIIGGITWACLTYLVSTFATDIGYSAIEQSQLFAIIYVISTSFILLITEHKTFIKKQRHTVYLMFPVVMMLSFLPGVFATKFVGAIMLFFMIFIGGARFAILDGFLNEEFGSEARATTFSTLNLLVQLLTALIIFINGPIQEKFSTKPMMTMLGFATILVVLPIAFHLIESTNKRRLA